MKGNQIRAARALLGWNGTDLALAAGVSLRTVRRMEEGADCSNLARDAVKRAIEGASVQFIEEKGVLLACAPNFDGLF